MNRKHPSDKASMVTPPCITTTFRGETRSEVKAGYLGAELGLKVALGRNCLARIGVRPSYLVGTSVHHTESSDEEVEYDFSEFQLALFLGMSGFW